MHWRLGPTPWVGTSQPSPVSTGGPTAIADLGRFPGPRRRFDGARNPQVRLSVEAVMLVFSRSEREGVRYLPPILRGNGAIPSFAVAGPLSRVV
jgi:hypothetical protein